jgi:ABC-type bacteriocin/lantibiotic exporter with double-glycine peptidase domain
MTPSLVLALSLLAGASGVDTEDLERFDAAWRKSRKACGPIALSYCLGRFGKRVPPSDIAEEADLGADGVLASRLLELSGKHGLQAQALVGNPNNYESLPTPSILILDSRHCVVYEGIDSDGGIRIFEPADGQRKVAIRDRLSKRWTGEVIVFERPRLSWFAFGAWASLGMCGTLLLSNAGSVLLNRRR